MKQLEILYSILISTLLIFIVAKYLLRNTWSSLLRNIHLFFKGRRTIGTISNVFVTNDSDGSKSFGIEISYADQYGNERKIRPEKRYVFSPFAGEKIKIVFLPSNSEIAEVNSFFLLFSPIINLGVIFIACAGIVIALIRQLS